MTISDYYDENGNIQELETLVQIKWNYRDKLRSGVTVKRLLGIDDEEYYVYDAEGNRIRKVEEKYIDLFTTRVTEKIYINNVEIKKIYTKIFMGSTTQELKRTTLHVMDDTRRIATVHNWTQDDNLREINTSGELNTNKIRYQYGNHINSASLELSSTGAIISYEEYFPYGDTSLIAGTAQKEVKLKEYRYTGKEKDDATGLYYYGARYYASWLGRWMSCDPLFRENPAVYDRPKGGSAEEQQQQHEEYMQKLYGEGLNMYGYVKGNPVIYNDLIGHNKQKNNIKADVFGKPGTQTLSTDGDIFSTSYKNDAVQGNLKSTNQTNANIATNRADALGFVVDLGRVILDDQVKNVVNNRALFGSVQYSTDVVIESIDAIISMKKEKFNKTGNLDDLKITSKEIVDHVMKTKVPDSMLVEKGGYGAGNFSYGKTMEDTFNSKRYTNIDIRFSEKHVIDLAENFIKGSNSLKAYYEKTSGYYGQGFHQKLKLFRLDKHSAITEKQFERLMILRKRIRRE